jgi:hypothetical protein
VQITEETDMQINFTSCNNYKLPEEKLKKGKKILCLSGERKLYPRKIKTKYGTRYVLDVGRRHRLISIDQLAWELVSHESYNRLT